MVEKILVLLDEKGWTQAALERAAGLSEARISKWKNHVGQPTARDAREIARLMGVSIAYLVDDDRTEREDMPLNEAERQALDIVRSLELTKAEVIRRLASPTALSPQDAGRRRTDFGMEEGEAARKGGKGRSVDPERGGRAG